MDFGLSEEQKLIAETTRAFVENELYPHEAQIERTGVLDMDLVRDIQKKGHRSRSLRRQHTGGIWRRRARYADMASL
jgi:alkylation response protein AidB-like acyl-CoA dehydrogenase